MIIAVGNSGALIAVLLFVLLFVVICKTLHQIPLLGGCSDILLSFCVAALCIISLLHVSSPPMLSQSPDEVSVSASEETAEPTIRPRLWDLILLPYLVLPWALLGVWLLSLLTKRQEINKKKPDKNSRKNLNITKSKPADCPDL